MLAVGIKNPFHGFEDIHQMSFIAKFQENSTLLGGGGGGGGEGGIDSIVLSADSLPLKLNQLSLSEVRFSMKLCKEDLPVNIFNSRRDFWYYFQSNIAFLFQFTRQTLTPDHNKPAKCNKPICVKRTWTVCDI